MPIKGMRVAAMLAATAALTVAACGGEDSPPDTSGASSGGSSEPVALKVGVLPIADLAPLYLGMDQGFFKEENLTIEPAVAEGGAAVVPAVMSGDNQIGFSNVTSIMNGTAQNLPLKPIAAGVAGASTEDEAWDALLAPKGGVTDLKQLEGKKVSVNTLKNLPEVAVRNSLEKAGVDLSKVEFVEIPFPDVPAALEAKRVDAAFAVEPFVGASVAAGATPLAAPFEQLAPDLTIAEYFTTEQYAKENADVVAARRRRTSPRWGAWRTSARTRCRWTSSPSSPSRGTTRRGNMASRSPTASRPPTSRSIPDTGFVKLLKHWCVEDSAPDQPDARRRADPRRRGAGHRRGALRGVPLRPRTASSSTGNIADYLVPMGGRVPDSSGAVETPTRAVRPRREGRRTRPGTAGAPAAVMNAINDALAAPERARDGPCPSRPSASCRR